MARADRSIGRACLGYRHCVPGAGLSTEAARAIKQWLTDGGVNGFAAYIHPDHHASAGVARHLGLAATNQTREGENRWATHFAETNFRSEHTSKDDQGAHH